MPTAPLLPSRPLSVPGIYVEEVDPGVSDIPAVTRDTARAALEDIVQRELRWLAYEVNTAKTRSLLVTNLRGILTMLWVTDGLKGETAQDAFFIRCDHTTMTQTDLDNGLLRCEVGMAPVRPSEFVTFRICIQLNLRP